MTGEVRTERRFGVTAQIEPRAVRNLFALMTSETWDDLLDVMEQVVIEIEGDLINTPAEDEAAVLANHKMSKAAWKVFTHLQQKVLQLSISQMSVANEPEVPPLTEEERERENILNPTIPIR